MDSLLGKLKWVGILLPIVYIGLLDLLCPVLYPMGQSHLFTHLSLFVLVVLGTGVFCFIVCRTLASRSEVDREITLLQEQQRLGRELHDDLAQLVAFLHLNLVAWERDLGPSPDAEVSTRVKELRIATEGIYEKVREAICIRREQGVPGDGFLPALKASAQEFMSRSKIPTHLELPADTFIPVSGSVATHLLRIVREALCNIYRHSDASEASIIAERVDDDLILTIADNGRGFNLVDGSPPYSQGLHIMRERAKLMHADLAVTTAPGEGTRITVRVPLDREKAKWRPFESSSLTTTPFSEGD